MSRITQVIVLVAAFAAVTACASKPKQVAVVAQPPASAPVPIYVTPPISPINRGLSPAATVWHMRVALNVAALACRGEQEAAIIQRYNAMLATHKAALTHAETALESQYRASGGDWQNRYDDAMTRLYNFFSQAQARAAFCIAAAATLIETERTTSGELQAFAAAVLPTLDAPFAELLAPSPMIAVATPASSRFTAQTRQPTVVTATALSPKPTAAVRPNRPPAALRARAIASPANAGRVYDQTARLSAKGQATSAPAAIREPAPVSAHSAMPARAVGTRVPWIEVDSSVLQN